MTTCAKGSLWERLAQCPECDPIAGWLVTQRCEGSVWRERLE